MLLWILASGVHCKMPIDAVPNKHSASRHLGVRPARSPARLSIVLLGILGLCILIALLGLTPHDPYALHVSNRFQPPSWQHWLGTDNLGRDTFSRIVYGGRVALYVSLVGVGSAMGLGLVIGTVAGYGPRWFDNIALFILDSARTFPTILLAMIIVTISGPSLNAVVIIVIVSMLSGYVRIVRTQTLSMKDRVFIQAERSLGAGPIRIVSHHIVPNVLGPLLIVACMDIPTVVALEAGLSFLGLGIRPPAASWGSTLQDGYAYIRNTPWLLVAAGLPLISVTLGFTFLGESLRDWLDPRQTNN